MRHWNVQNTWPCQEIIFFMREEEILECVTDIDLFLSQAEAALESKDLKSALLKIREARSTIEDMREDDEIEIDNEEIGMDVMKKLK